VEAVFHQLNHYVVSRRLESFQRDRMTTQLKRHGYRELREPRVTRHWANR
jgi:hypothetical protein